MCFLTVVMGRESALTLPQKDVCPQCVLDLVIERCIIKFSDREGMCLHFSYGRGSMCLHFSDREGVCIHFSDREGMCLHFSDREGM